MCRRRWRRGSGCLARAGRTRTTRTTPSRSRSPRLRAPALRQVAAADHAEVLRLLAKRNIDIGNHRTRVVCRLHNLLMELAPGGIAKELNASDADRAPRARRSRRHRSSRPATTWPSSSSPTCSASTPSSRSRTGGSAPPSRARGRSLTELFGVGPIIACYLIGFTGDVSRFAQPRPATPPTTAPPPSSGPRAAASCTALSQRGNRRLNHALHLAAICQIRQPHSEGRAYFDRKVAEGKTKKEARARPEAPDQQRRLPPARSSTPTERA